MRQAAVAVARARAESDQAWSGLLPSLSASGAWTRNEHETSVAIPDGPTATRTVVIAPRDQLEAAVKVELPLIDATKWMRTWASLGAVDAASRKEESARDDARRQVLSAYYAFAGSNLVLESARRSLAAAQAQLAWQGARTGAGVATDLEKARAKAEVERSAQVVADAEAALASAGRLLRTLSGLEPKRVPVLPPDDLSQEPALAELEARVDGLPAVAAAEKDVEVAARNRHAALAAFAPTVSAQVGERLTNATGFSGKDSQWSAGVSLGWRLDVASAQGLRVVDAAEAAARLAAERARNVARDQIHSDWQRVRAGLTKVSAAQAQVAAARRASELASDRYGAGLATQLDVIQADRDRFAAEVADVQARFELASSRGSLRLSAGLPLEVAP